MLEHSRFADEDLNGASEMDVAMGVWLGASFSEISDLRGPLSFEALQWPFVFQYHSPRPS